MKPATADRVWLAFGHFAVAAMALAAGWLIQSQGQNLPVMDEWYLLPQCLESRSLVEWAFEHHNEHRFPITKLAWAGLLKATNFNLKAPMYASLIALASAAVLMQWTARRIRGHSHPVDALYAVLLLHFGHCFTFLMGYQLGFALFAYGIAGWLWCAAQLARGGGTIWVILAGVFSALILQCGGFGLAFTPVIAGWFGFAALQAFRKSKLFSGGLCAGFAIGFVAYGAWVYLTMPKFVTEEGLDPLDYPFDFIAAIVGYLMSGLGQWPTGLGPVGLAIVGIAVAIVFGLGFIPLIRWSQSKPEQRLVALAVLGVLLGTLLIGIAAAKARGGGLTERYTTPCAAGWAAMLLVAASGKGNRLLTLALVSLGAGLIWMNIGPGLRFGYYIRLSLWEMQRDLDDGMPAEFLAGRYGGTLGVFVGDNAAILIRKLHVSGVPQFGKLAADPKLKAIPVEGFPESSLLTKQLAERIGPGGTIPGMTFHPPVGAVALRMKVTTVRSAGWHRLTAVWLDPASGQERQADAHPHSTLVSLHLIFPFEGRPEAIRVTFASAVQELRIDEVEWLVPETLR